MTPAQITHRAAFYTGAAVACAYTAVCVGVLAGMWWTTLYGCVRR